ncbi:hypothetical protein AYI70_g5005 [Smittium culicis]|uniref:Uncharacterized protein n=1 Tax=Smittium culicis TaxID=133412 RepID=A0A1R1XWL7_9FUNG|nr:hypothetical protein AYI70_g5005 [Smittium culicis]
MEKSIMKPSHVTPTLGTEEYMSVEEESMEINGDIDRAGNSESTILGHSTAIMEWSVIPPRDTRAQSFYRCERLGMGNSCGIQILLRIMESIGGVDAHQRQRIIDNFIRYSTQECYSPFSISLLRQYYHIGLRQEILRDNLATAVGDIGKDFETLFRYEYTPTSLVYTVCDKSYRRSESFNRAERMSERTELQLEEMRQPLRLPSMEPNITSYTESSEGTTNNNIDYPPLENCSMEPRSTEAINSLAITAASRNGSTGSKKLKISLLNNKKWCLMT